MTLNYDCLENIAKYLELPELGRLAQVSCDLCDISSRQMPEQIWNQLGKNEQRFEREELRLWEEAGDDFNYEASVNYSNFEHREDYLRNKFETYKKRLEWLNMLDEVRSTVDMFESECSDDF